MSPRPDELRIGDAERERAQAMLADHYAAGRLDHDEYSERLDRIWSAKTQGDLAPVFGDLPGQRPAYSTPPQQRAMGTPPRPGPRLPVPLLALFVVLAGITVVSHLPIILVALVVWFFFLRGGCRPRPWSHQWSHRRW